MKILHKMLDASSVRVFLLSALIVGIFALASCSNNNPSSNLAPDKNTRALGMANTVSRAVSSNGTGGMEVINGITVPPEPSPTLNNTTLAGVDVNRNGVRDDVERLIAEKITKQEQFTPALNVARVYQTIITSAVPVDRTGALLAYSRLVCAAGSNYIIGQNTSFMRDAFENTADRKAKLNQIDALLDGGFMGSELPACQ